MRRASSTSCADLARRYRLALGGSGADEDTAAEIGATFLGGDPVAAADAVTALVQRARRPVLDGWRSLERRPARRRDRQRAARADRRAAWSRRRRRRAAASARATGARCARASRGLVRLRERDGTRRAAPARGRPGAAALRPDARLDVDGRRGRLQLPRSPAACSRAARAARSASRRPSGDPAELRVAVEGFFPRLGVLLGPLQRRFHVHVSRRYFRAWLAEARAMRIAVLGATGFVGRALVPVLAERAEVVAVSRSGGAEQPGVRRSPRARHRRERRAPRARRRRGRLPPRPLARLAGLRRRSTAAPPRPSRARPSAPACAQIVYLGGLGDDRPDLSEHLRSRIETAEALAAGPVPVTTLRAAVVVGRGSAAFETIVALVDRLPAMVAPRWISTPTQPIALADVVALPRRRRAAARRRSARASTSAAPTSSPTAR